jgi:hypothetical protein
MNAGQRSPDGDEVLDDPRGRGGFIDLRRRRAELGRPDLLATEVMQRERAGVA